MDSYISNLETERSALRKSVSAIDSQQASNQGLSDFLDAAALVVGTVFTPARFGVFAARTLAAAYSVGPMAMKGVKIDATLELIDALDQLAMVEAQIRIYNSSDPSSWDGALGRAFSQTNQAYSEAVKNAVDGFADRVVNDIGRDLSDRDTSQDYDHVEPATSENDSGPIWA